MEKNILLVDDSPTTRKIVGFFLKEKGYKIIEANNGIEALEKMAYSKIDLIITDLNMPKMDGLELVSSINSDLAFKDIPIIIITTEDQEQKEEEGMKLGASAYLKKPISKSTLIKEVENLIKI